MLTVAVVGYAAAGMAGGLLAVAVAFAPSFVFVLAGGPHFGRIRGNALIQSFFSGAGPAVIGAIAGSAIPLGLAFQVRWQIPVLAGVARLAVRGTSRGRDRASPCGCDGGRARARRRLGLSGVVLTGSCRVVGKIPRVKRSNDQRRIRCARCGEARLIPLTVHHPQAGAPASRNA